MQVQLAYGQAALTLDLPADRTTVIQPREEKALPDERGATLNALQHPIGSAPLRSLLRQDSTVCITFSDITRATPNHRLIPWLLEHLQDFPTDRITLINQTGTHRPSSQAELEHALTPEVVRRYRVLNHDHTHAETLVQVGTLRDGTPALINRHVVEAGLRIVTGFIEPHFFAGFSGGPKGIIPGCAGLQTILSNHGSRNLSHPKATFGHTRGNPLWEELLEVALRLGPTFLLNVTLNARKEITGVFAGDLVAAHQAGTEAVTGQALHKVSAPFDLVLTTNSGYPLDLNLYQGVKGMSAAARIVKPGGTILLLCECREGVPAGSPYETLLRQAKSPDDLLQRLKRSTSACPEQWQAQIQALIQQHARILLHSLLPDDVVRACHLEPCHDPALAVASTLQERPTARIAVLPHGPLVIPTLAP